MIKLVEDDFPGNFPTGQFESLYISGKLPIYPTPKPTLICFKWEVSVNVGLGEGVGGQFPRNV